MLSLSVADLGSGLWYFLQLKALHIPCNGAFAFFGTVFEPASVLCVTWISISMLVLLRKSLVLQTRKQMKHTLVFLIVCCCFISWTLPIVLSVIFLTLDQYGSDQVYCWLDINSSNYLRVYAYYTPILCLLILNVVLMILIYVSNSKLKLGLTKLALLWVPLSLLVTWVVPAVTIIWDYITSTSNPPPFWLLFTSSLLLPGQGFFNAVLFFILLGRARKRVERSLTHFEGSDIDDDFNIDEVALRIFGEKIFWYFCE